MKNLLFYHIFKIFLVLNPFCLNLIEIRIIFYWIRICIRIYSKKLQFLYPDPTHHTPAVTHPSQTHHKPVTHPSHTHHTPITSTLPITHLSHNHHTLITHPPRQSHTHHTSITHPSHTHHTHNTLTPITYPSHSHNAPTTHPFFGDTIFFS